MMSNEQRQKWNAYGKEVYNWNKMHGICVKCRHTDALPGRVLCQECNRKHLNKQSEEKEKRREYMRLYMRKVRQRQKETLCNEQ